MSQEDLMDLNALSIFDAVAQTRSFTAAADKLGIAKAKVSLQISRLEQQLGASLFTRTTRQVQLTDAGRELHVQAQPLLAGLREALTQLAAGHATPATLQGQLRGQLRVSASVNHASQSVAPALAQFALRHPDLKLDLRTADSIRDLVADGIDLSFRVGWLKDSSNRAIKLADFRQYVLASPAYLERYGTPRHPSELAQHAWISLSLLPTPLTWTFTRADQQEIVQMKSRIQVDAPSALSTLLIQGAGVSVLEELSAQQALQNGELRRILSDWELPIGGVYAVLPPGRHVPVKVRAFIDFYRDFMHAKLN